VGHTESFASHHWWMIELNADGDSLWSGVQMRGECMDVIRTAADHYLLAGEAWPTAAPDGYGLVKMTATGEEVWSRMYQWPEPEDCRAIVPAVGGGYYVAGSSNSFGNGLADYLVIKISESGDSLWSASCGSDYRENCHGAAPTRDGGCILAGESDRFDPLYEPWLVKASADGDTLWTTTCGRGTGAEFCRSIACCGDSGFIVCGWADNPDTSGVLLVRLGIDELAVHPDAALAPRAFMLHSNYPNPFNPATTIPFSLTSTGTVRLRVFDLAGREVATLVDQILSAGDHAVRFDGSPIASGTYIYRLEADRQSESGRMTLLR